MRKLFVLFLGLMLVCSSVFAQDPLTQKVPMDSSVRTGVLDNGMTYYIRKNSKPENSANFHIVTNVGAAQELDNENGLAHFLEHMAFNGIKSFPHATMLEYLQNNGVQFGRNINASTGYDVTQYFLQDIPITKTEGILDTAMLIIRDWSCNILLDPTEIDEERGVISEELRGGDTPSRRLQEERLHALANGTIYSKRNVIGELDWLRDFKRSDILGFYQKWYRPNHQAVIFSGDFDLDEMESKVKALFSEVPAQKNVYEKEIVDIPKYDKSFAKIHVDTELTGTDVWISYPVKAATIATNDQMGAMIQRYMFGLLNTVLTTRLSKISKTVDSPFVSAMFADASVFASNQLALVLSTIKTGRELEALEVIGTEINRMKQFGVTSSELSIAVEDLKKMNETSYNNRNDRTNTQLAFECISNFTNNIPIIDPATDYNYAMGILDNVTKDIINQYVPILFNNENMMVSLGAPSTEVTEPQILEAYQKGLNSSVEPLEDKVIDKNILDKSTLVRGMALTQAIDKFESNMWILSNGAIVIFKPTEYKNDEILFYANKKGGVSLFDDEECGKADAVATYLTLGHNGVGKYSASDLDDALAGVDAGVDVFIDDYASELEGSSSSADIETLFKLINLNLTQPRFTDEDIMTSKATLNNFLANFKNSPDMVFSDAVAKASATNPNRSKSIESLIPYIDSISVENVTDVYNKAFCGARGMKFIFVGNAPVEQVKELAEIYIASIPAGKETFVINREDLNAPSVAEKFVVKQADDKANVNIAVSNKVDKDLNTELELGILSDILTIRYTKIVREEMGATYGVRGGLSFTYTPRATIATLNASYKTNDGFVNETSKVITDQINDIAVNGVDDAEFLKAVSNRKKNYINNQIINDYWLSVIEKFYTVGYDSHVAFEKAIEKIDMKDIQKAAQKMMKEPRIVDVRMTSNPIE